jgi:hypothetical protein
VSGLHSWAVSAQEQAEASVPAPQLFIACRYGWISFGHGRWHALKGRAERNRDIGPLQPQPGRASVRLMRIITTPFQGVPPARPPMRSTQDRFLIVRRRRPRGELQMRSLLSLQ